MAESTDIMFEIDDNLPEAIERLEEFETKLGDMYDNVEGLNDITPDELVEQLENAQELGSGLGDVADNLNDHFDLSQDQVASMTGEIEEAEEALKEVVDVQTELQEALLEGNDQRAEELTSDLKNQFDRFEEESHEALEMFKSEGESIGESIMEGIDGEKIGETVGDTFSKAAEGDLQGIMTSAASSVDNVLFGEGGMTTPNEGPGGGEEGGGGGAVGTAISAGSSAAGPAAEVSARKGWGFKKMLGKVGGLVSKFSGVLAGIGGLTALVGVLGAAYGQAKDLNSEMMTSVSYAEMYASSFGQANDAMRQLRESATSRGINRRLGLEAQDHMEIISALHKEGAQLRELRGEYEDFQKMGKESVETVRVAALNLATDEKEVAKFAGTMMDKHSSTFKSIKGDLGEIQEYAVAADMSTKSFFSSVQQMTSQLALYNYNLGDSVEMLSKMSQYMDEENAKQFTEQMVKGFKEMGHQERLRTAALTDQEEIRGMIKESAEENLQTLKEQKGAFQGTARVIEEVTGKTVKNTEDMKKQFENMSPEQRQEVMTKVEADLGEKAFSKVSDAANMIHKASGNVTQLSDVMADLGGMEHMELQIRALENSLNKPISEMSSMVTKQFGVNQDQLRMLRRTNEISEGGYTALQRAMKENEDEGLSKQQKAVQKVADRLGLNVKATKKGLMRVDEKTGKVAGKIEDNMDVVRAMKDETKEELDESDQRSMAEKQIDATQSISRYLKTAITDMLNFIGDTILSFESTFLDWWGVEDPKRKEELRIREEKSQTRDELAGIERDIRSSDDPKEVDRLKEERKRLRQKIADLDKQSKRLKSAKDEIENTKEGWFNWVDEKRKKAQYVKSGLKDEMSFEKFKEKQAAKVEEMEQEILSIEDDEKQDRIAKKYGMKVHRKRPGMDGPAEGTSVKVADYGSAYSTAANKIGGKPKMQSELKEVTQGLREGNLSPEEAQRQRQMIFQKYERRGIALNDKAKKKMKEATGEGYLNAMKKRSIVKELQKGGFKGEKAVELANKVLEGKVDPKSVSDHVPKGSSKNNKKTSTLKTVSANWKEGEDVRMVTGGIPPLNLQEGDVIVDQQELAKTVRGKAGEFAPDVVNKNKMSESGKGGNRAKADVPDVVEKPKEGTKTKKGKEGQNIMNATFNINGGNSQELERKILQVIDIWERGGGSI
jgi:hypothetical protein